jgi:hypothetical protein
MKFGALTTQRRRELATQALAALDSPESAQHLEAIADYLGLLENTIAALNASCEAYRKTLNNVRPH